MYLVYNQLFMFRRCVEGHNLVRTVGDKWMVGLDVIL